ncbi:MAG: HEAT repeat domain-containing protein, partial [Verrucomicrobia bacterium]|nr:HEAT repeat domain-containing protein [Verrucomicrobiota bacterium]
TSAATAALRKALSGNGPAPARAKALAALVEADPETAFPFVVQSLQAEARPLRRAAAFLLRRYPAAQIVKALEPKWSAFTPAARRWICAALRDLGDPAGRSLILKELAAAAPADRAPAIAALGATGGAEDVATLLRKAASGSPEEQQAARTALDRMRAPGVEAELSRAARGADESVAAEAILALGRRGAADAAPLLLQIARTGPAAAREPALKALRAVARPEDLPELIELAETVPEESFDAALDTLHAAALRWNRASETARRLSAAFRAAAPQARRERLLRTLARFGGPEALAALREALRSPLQATALRLLAGWPDAEPLPDVRAALASADTPALHTLAMRAYLRLADRDESADAAERLARCRFAWSRARSVEERRLVLAGAGQCLTPDALSWAAQALEDEAVRPEAQAALLQLCVGLRGADPDACAAILRRIAAAPASEQFRAQARQTLEAIAASREWLCAWQASPPYAQPGKSCAELFDIAFAPETAPQNTPWRILPPSPTPGQPWLMDLLALYPQEQAVAYARTHLWLPAEREAILHLGTDDGFKLWVNGRLVAKHNVMRAVQPDQEKIPIRLRQGWNDLLLKVTQNNQGWGFCARLTGPDGAPLSDGQAAAELP